MSLKAQAICPVPQETARIARAAYPKGKIYMQMRDVLGSIYTEERKNVEKTCIRIERKRNVKRKCFV